jgi:ssDNA-binding Zn-finger/Zn-ribbon topoisomerase 1
MDDIKQIDIEIKKESSENNLGNIIENKIIYLKQLLPKVDDSLKGNYQKYIKQLKNYLCNLNDFISLKEDLKQIYNKEHYAEISREIIRLKRCFKNFALIKRIEKEERELSEIIDKVISSGILKETHDINERILKLQANPPVCKRGHNMVIREHDDDYFWGCSEFPFCFMKKCLTKNERDYLFSTEEYEVFFPFKSKKKKDTAWKTIKEHIDNRSKNFKYEKRFIETDTNSSKKETYPKHHNIKIKKLCPNCGSPMVVRVAQNHIKFRGQKFWGCTKYPKCRGKSTYYGDL